MWGRWFVHRPAAWRACSIGSRCQPRSWRGMRTRVALGVVFVLGLSLGTGACRKTIVYPIYCRRVISSVVAFPTTLGPGDSTLITITASDPDGDTLVYDWAPYNGLTTKGGNSNTLNHVPNASMVFYAPMTWSYDTAFVWCYATDARGGY